MRLGCIEFFKLVGFGFAVWCLGAVAAIGKPGESFSDLISFLLLLAYLPELESNELPSKTRILVRIFTQYSVIGLKGILLGSWAIYNGYIRIARAGGRLLDVGLWIIASLLTASYTFWAWSILDINRLIVSKLLYRGDAPVELAWSVRSKKVRKAWEKARKAGYA